MDTEYAAFFFKTVFQNVIRSDRYLLVTPGMHAKTHTGSHAQWSKPAPTKKIKLLIYS
jgi:hypothetical protein